jgi:hypothetical protein
MDIVVGVVFYVVAALMWWLEPQHHFKETSAMTASIAYGIPYVVYYKIYAKHNIQHMVILMSGSSCFAIYISQVPFYTDTSNEINVLHDYTDTSNEINVLHDYVTTYIASSCVQNWSVENPAF